MNLIKKNWKNKINFIENLIKKKEDYNWSNKMNLIQIKENYKMNLIRKKYDNKRNNIGNLIKKN